MVGKGVIESNMVVDGGGGSGEAVGKRRGGGRGEAVGKRRVLGVRGGQG